jgi:2-keto-4-pentenoate hydratase/2-oxohepta-3-ene-1,7-dioic acid hydratase in catechol pathway
MVVSLPARPDIFCKFHTSVIGPGDPILLPRASHQVDYEGELAVVIGRRCFDVAETEALSYVAGYTIMNDVTARDLQFQTSQWTLGKAADTFAPLGPVLLSADEVPDPQDLQLTTRLNDEIVQDASTVDMIFGVAQIISAISRSITLECGDVIATGTPEGVGYKRNPPRFLTDGDVVKINISGIGTLSNPVRSGHRPP